jgi:hypothetical protein
MIIDDAPLPGRVMTHSELHEAASNGRSRTEDALTGGLTGWIPEDAPAPFCEGAANAVHAAFRMARELGLHNDRWTDEQLLRVEQAAMRWEEAPPKGNAPNGSELRNLARDLGQFPLPPAQLSAEVEGLVPEHQPAAYYAGLFLGFSAMKGAAGEIGFQNSDWAAAIGALQGRSLLFFRMGGGLQ